MSTALLVGASTTLAVLGACAPWSRVRTPRRRGETTSDRSPGTRRQGAGGDEGSTGGVALDPAFVLDLCATAVRGGTAVPAALVVTGRHLGGEVGDALGRAGAALGMGAPWDVAWSGAPVAASVVGDALRTAWSTGASPAPRLRAAADRARRERRARARAASGALGVRLTLPLGVCFLPAFVLLGLIPVVLGLAGDLVVR